MSVAATASLTSCFTGVESTQAIKLSRSDTREIAPSAEDLYLADISGTPLGKWKEGRQFYVADDKIAVMLVQRTLPVDQSLQPHRGDILTYAGTQPEHHPDGSVTTALVLEGTAGKYLYDTGISMENAPKDFNSLDMAVLIDMETVHAVDRRMHGNTYWTRTQLWYDDEDEDFVGRKYIPVTVTAVTPGNMIFPLKVTFQDNSGTEGNYYMNPEDGSQTSSRRFASLFYLTDLKKQYPNIEPDVWELIQRGRVRQGMTKQECRLSMGLPADADSGRSYANTLDLWKYDGGRYLQFEDGILVDYRQ